MISNHFLCKDWESSNWNNHLYMVVGGSRQFVSLEHAFGKVRVKELWLSSSLKMVYATPSQRTASICQSVIAKCHAIHPLEASFVTCCSLFGRRYKAWDATASILSLFVGGLDCEGNISRWENGLLGRSPFSDVPSPKSSHWRWCRTWPYLILDPPQKITMICWERNDKQSCLWIFRWAFAGLFG